MQQSSTTPNDPELEAFNSGQLLVYPTEAVMGIGCDPDNQEAVFKLLALKQRPVEKGVILIADNYSRLLKYVDDNAIAPDKRTEIFSSWPGAVTWLLPKSRYAPEWITGKSNKIAVRVTNHPVVKALCEKLAKPLVSTSANLSGQAPAKTTAEARKYFYDSVYYIEGKVGERDRPSTIRDCETGKIIRE
ncbi:L-threonylcarbamoyladenylate synthase type 1 TsaC [Alteromonas pelagimontana]|uniref:Threonylcarbamoyl-AMP synthase n=1 Tax=Alteromonas pelagimontana TaxID=1858656 RepID=A0A6M4MCV2_9ALTE|nr:Sua5/YciO/YrdC/YwlC family protein [Alteromonas pelagimontana]QJR81001.1 L-threonylcarbamoyladenylate synthase type 1 TsaC [Alteromonas pelagimontana]